MPSPGEAGYVQTFPFCGACGWFVPEHNIYADARCDACGMDLKFVWSGGDWANAAAVVKDLLLLPPQNVVFTPESLPTLGWTFSWDGTYETEDAPVWVEVQWSEDLSFDRVTQNVILGRSLFPGSQATTAGSPNQMPPQGEEWNYRFRKVWNPAFIWHPVDVPGWTVTHLRAFQALGSSGIGGVDSIGWQTKAPSGFTGSWFMEVRGVSGDVLLNRGNMGNQIGASNGTNIWFEAPVASGTEAFVRADVGGATFDLPSFVWDTDLEALEVGSWSETFQATR